MKYLIVMLSVVWLAACQMPSEHVVVGDNSSGLSFQLVDINKDVDYQVYVDGLLMGDAKSFLSGKAILKILPGSHVIKVIKGGEVVLEEKLYVASGANKVLVVR